MVRHLVMFKLREFSNADEKIRAVETLRTKLIDMKKQIRVIREFEVGININPGNSAYDLVINSTFSSKDELKVYQVHPAHQEFILFNKNYSESKVIVDYEY